MARRPRPRRAVVEPAAPVDYPPALAVELERLDARYPEGHMRAVLLPLMRAGAIHEHTHGGAPDDGCHLCATPAYRAAHGLRPALALAPELADIDEE
ncbi:hypothetical protein FSW04_17930 [Baekduia soli]|uniref:Uncharacterized protein n=1 Tax=Baekduia soli TaxID=496014 RepID=A0A5B8U9F9_9ACTN|nr:hypothetical protein [Baekduia soli]QEC49272.1 hypothetical protein FSW04_17930 [Baekduia soli]